MSAVYDYESSARNDPLVSIAENYLHAAVPGLAPENIVLLKAFPFRKCLVESTIRPAYVDWESA